MTSGLVLLPENKFHDIGFYPIGESGTIVHQLRQLERLSKQFWFTHIQIILIFGFYGQQSGSY